MLRLRNPRRDLRGVGSRGGSEETRRGAVFLCNARLWGRYLGRRSGSGCSLCTHGTPLRGDGCCHRWHKHSRAGWQEFLSLSLQSGMAGSRGSRASCGAGCGAEWLRGLKGGGHHNGGCLCYPGAGGWQHWLCGGLGQRPGVGDVRDAGCGIQGSSRGGLRRQRPRAWCSRGDFLLPGLARFLGVCNLMARESGHRGRHCGHPN